ncbi:MAG: single-stranded-DNA-specific exonuclease RecJ [Candidatus Margulisbacteria bacterium]|nr:single-stranded-DNA-specific exonuclease RecJ [Candidatus Margulisiibacteriota bacterium]
MKQWIFNTIDETKRDALAARLGISKLLGSLLLVRGETDPTGAAAFLAPKISFLRDPFEIPNLKEGAQRLILAKQRGEKVAVFGDYDVDGVTGTAIVSQALKTLGIPSAYYIPHRYGEGYGLSVEALRKLAADGTRLVITVDCGISNIHEVAAAKELGMAVVVTDHHNLPAELPGADAVVNPKMLSQGHPSRELAGAGVAFKFAWGLLRTAGLKDSVFLTSLLDLAALGTLADVVPLTGENRILSATGLNILNKRQRLGIKELAEAAGLKGVIGADQVYFGLAPRLNAAGRLEHAGRSVDLLLTDDPGDAGRLAKEIDQINSRRKETGSRIKEEVFSRLSAGQKGKAIVMSGADWSPGVIGIVASQVAETCNRPAVLIGVSDGFGRGSARSIGKLNIFNYLAECRDLFIDFGGHPGAAGFKIAEKNIPLFERRFIEETDRGITDEELVPALSIDAEVSINELSLAMVKEVARLAPFGAGNPVPVLMMRDLAVSSFRTLGGEGQHLKIKFNRGGAEIEAIGFGLGKLAELLDYSRRYDLAFNLESNEWNGFETAQLRIVDLKESAGVI